MELKRSGSQPSGKGSEEYFTGMVRIDPLFQAPEPARVLDHGTQPGDPAKLGDALVKIAGMENPPKVFVAGSDAFPMITSAVESRLREMHADEALSKSTDGSF
jgi:hypothetical protein